MNPKTRHSCSTFLLSTPDGRLVGHNLDEYIEVPGLVVANPRGFAKENISWQDLTGFRSRSRPRVRWVSKYGSITCNMFGKEFPDGGLNEAGLYIGEMTLFGTKYPQGKGLPKIYHNQWLQYILDNFETVEQVLASLSQVIMDGHCQWHFFTVDKLGNTAAIEFPGGQWKDIQPDEVRTIKAYIDNRRSESSSTPFDLAFGGRMRSADWEQDRAHIRSMAQAGVTW